MRFPFKNYPLPKGEMSWWAILRVQIANPAKHSPPNCDAQYIRHVFAHIVLDLFGGKNITWVLETPRGTHVGALLKGIKFGMSPGGPNDPASYHNLNPLTLPSRPQHHVA